METQKQTEIEQFIEKLLDDKKLLGSRRADEKEKLSEKIDDLVDRAIIGALPDEKLDQLGRVLVDGEVSQEQIDKIINDSDVDITKIVQQTLEKFKNEYLGGNQNA